MNHMLLEPVVYIPRNCVVGIDCTLSASALSLPLLLITYQRSLS